MAHPDQFDGGAEPAAQSGISRRKLIATGATLAVAGAAVGTAGTFAVSAIGGEPAAAGPVPEEPVMVHLKDARSGQLDLFVGTRRFSFTDRTMAARLAEAANNATE